LSALEDDLKNKTRLVKELETKLRGSSQRIAKLSREIDGTDTRLQRSRTLLRQRLRAMYKQGRMGYVGVLLSADDFSGAGRRLKYLSALAAQDQRLIKAYNTSLTDLSEKRAEFARYKKRCQATGKARLRNQIVEEQRYRVLLAKSARTRPAAWPPSGTGEIRQGPPDAHRELQSDGRQRRASRAARSARARGQGAAGNRKSRWTSQTTDVSSDHAGDSLGRRRDVGVHLRAAAPRFPR
jgi:septal ring factor EnvC (AmiA/AmiB activator)